MSRVVLCLLFIAVFQNGIQKSYQESEAPEVTEESTKTSEKNLETAASKEEATSNVTKKAIDKPAEETEAKAESKKGDVTEVSKTSDSSTASTPTTASSETTEASTKTSSTKTSSTSPKAGTITKPSTYFVDPIPSDYEFPNNFLGPMMHARATIESVVSKGFNGAKDFADGALTFLRNSATKLF